MDVYLRVVSDDTLAFNIETSWYCFSGPQINDERKFFEFESYEKTLCISALKNKQKYMVQVWWGLWHLLSLSIN